MGAPRFRPQDPEKVVQAYKNGRPLHSIATEYGVTFSTIRALLVARGVNIRTPGESRRWSPENPDAVIAAYLGGETEQAIAAQHGRDRTAIRGFLLRHGVTRRGLSEAMLIRMANTTPAERQRLSTAAHDAIRGKPTSHKSRQRIALARERTRQMVGRGEEALADLLRLRGIETAPQLAVDTFNVDLAAPPVAIELLVNMGNPLTRKPDRKKIAYLTAVGWDVIYAWITQRHFLGPATADAIVAFVKETAVVGRGTGRTRVVRGSGVVVYDGHGLPSV